MSRADRILVASVASALLLAGAGAWVLLSGPTGTAAAPGPLAVEVSPSGSLPIPASGQPASSPSPAVLIVDVQGAVVRPGVHELAAGARVADALSAAGGYAADADLEAAATTINLAAPLVDGQQIAVPRIGAAAPPASAPGGSGSDSPSEPGSGPGGPVDLNTATAAELEALPGIGPVTVEKILAARAERPFASLEDAVARGALDRGQLEDIEGLATAG